MNFMRNITAIAAVYLLSAVVAVASPFGEARIEKVVSGLDQPWSIGFLPDGGVLITERGGRLNHFSADGQHNAVAGLPAITVNGQGGLMDVLVPSDFARSRQIFLAINAPDTGTAVVRAQLASDYQSLTNVERYFTRSPARVADIHFGGRLLEDTRGRIFVSVGDHGRSDDAQDQNSHSGKLVMIRDHAGQKTAQIFSSGHRNPQGFAVGRSGTIWAHEHGAKGGDELNEIRAGRNYGWPIISYGVNYDNTQIGIGTSADGLEQPKYYWDPSIAPSGLAIYSGKLWPNLRGAFLIGSLKFDRIDVLDEGLKSLGAFSDGTTGRVRDVREAPDGSIWYLSVLDGAAYRMTPAR